MIDDRSVDKLTEIFSDRFERIRSDLWDRLKPKDYSGSFERKLDESWADYLNGLDCTYLDKSDILNDFQAIANRSVQGRVCIYDEESDEYILVPIGLAKKALVLGGLPDQWFPEEAAS